MSKVCAIVQRVLQQAHGPSVGAEVDPTGGHPDGGREGGGSVLRGCRRQDLQVAAVQQRPGLHR